MLVSRSIAALFVAAAFLAPAVALAADPTSSDAPVATAKGSPVAPPDTTSADIKQFIADGAKDDDNGPLPDKKPHGFVSVGAGTHGYREVAGAVTAPIGDTGQVSIAVDSTQFDGRKH